MKRSAIIIFSAILTIGNLAVFWSVRERYSPIDLYKHKNHLLEKKIAALELQRQLDAEQEEQFQQEVAAALPQALQKVTQKNKDYALRNLASVVMRPQKDKLYDLVAKSVFESGKALFRKGEYVQANRLFQKVIDRYGFSTQVIEAHFLLAEGLYQTGELDRTTQVIDQMVELFPDSELTGFALLRLGQIFETRDRFDEAVQIYRMVSRIFPYRSVASQAEKNLRGMEP